MTLPFIRVYWLLHIRTWLYWSHGHWVFLNSCEFMRNLLLYVSFVLPWLVPLIFLPCSKSFSWVNLFPDKFYMERVICLEPSVFIASKIMKKTSSSSPPLAVRSFHFNWVDCSLSRVHSWFIYFLILLRAYGRYKGS